jgi:uncharacterized membrane protein
MQSIQIQQAARQVHVSDQSQTVVGIAWVDGYIRSSVAPQYACWLCGPVHA